MKVYDSGVLITSNLYFHTPSETGRRLYFYPVCCGHYYCDDGYVVDRPDYNSFLLLYVKKGSGYVVINGRPQPIAEGSAFLLDCYRPHRYGSQTGWEIVWVHFDGQPARSYFETICPTANCRIFTPPDPHNIHRCLAKTFAMFHEKGVVSEPQTNKYIVNALTDFLVTHSGAEDKASSITEELLSYITENIQQPLTLESLAKRAALSPFYFTRLFKKETGYTPHEYLVTARVNAAKFYLKTTMLPVKEITFLCGFSSESSFCTTFKRVVGTTPVTYRSSSL